MTVGTNDRGCSFTKIPRDGGVPQATVAQLVKPGSHLLLFELSFAWSRTHDSPLVSQALVLCPAIHSLHNHLKNLSYEQL